MIRLVLTLACIVCATVAAAAERVALVLGNGDYIEVPALKNPANDARAVAGSLERLGFEVVLGIDLDMEGMRRKLYDFARLAYEAKVALFFYAGHGVQVYGKNYLLPIDAKLQEEPDLDFATVEVDLVLKQMNRAAPITIVILDACRDNPFVMALSRSMGQTRSTQALGRGLAEIKVSGGTLIAFATDPGDVALDGDGEHSPFTAALLEHMETPDLEINSLMQRVRTHVFEQTGQRQRPWTATSLIEEVYLSPETEREPEPVSSAAVVTPAPPTAPQVTRDITLEIAVWQAAEHGGTVADYEAYLDKFPDGAFVGLAQGRIARLKDDYPEDDGFSDQPEKRERLPSPSENAVPMGTPATEDALGLNLRQRREIQQRLKLTGHDPRGIDGVFGPGSRSAIAAWQAAAGHVPSGYLDGAQLTALNTETESAFAKFEADEARAAKARAERTRAGRTVSTYRAKAHCSITGVTGWGEGADPQHALYNAALNCIARGGVPECCTSGAQRLN